MALESATHINELDEANPVGADAISQGDNHLRQLKDVVKRDLDTNRHWIYISSATYATTTTFTVSDDSEFHSGRRVKLTGGLDRYGTVSSVSSGTITVTDIVDSAGASATLHSNLNKAFLGPAANATSPILRHYPPLADETGAVNYEYPVSFPFLDVRRYGAVGDGSTDDTAAIQAAQDYLESAGGGTLFFPYTGSSYRFTALTIDAPYINWLGASDLVELECTAATGDALTISKTVVSLENMRITADTGTRVTSGNGITIAHTETYTMNRVRLVNVQVDDQPGNGIEAQQPELFYFRDVWVERAGGIGFYFHDNTRNIGINCTFINCRAWECTGRGWYIWNQINYTFIGCESLKSGGSDEVWFRSGTGHNWINGDIERTTVAGTGITMSGSFHRVTGGTIQKTLNGIALASATGCIVDNPRLVGDASTAMATGVSIDGSSTDCKVALQRSPTNVTTRISDSGTNTVLQTGSEYKNVDVIPTRQVFSGTTPVIVDVELGLTIQQTLTQATTVNAPSNSQIGQELTFIMIQDGTGSHAVTWNSVYKFDVAAWSNAGNSANTRSMITFKFDGSGWRQVGDQNPYI